MKANFFIIAIVFYFNALHAQDVIIKMDGSVIQGTVTEVNESDLKYIKADSPGGPAYSISKDKVFSVNYANGVVEKFKGKAVQEDGEDGTGNSGSIVDNAPLKRTIESIAMDAGEQLKNTCADGPVDNSVTEIYWDGVIKDVTSGEIIIPIRCKWYPTGSEGLGKWIKGKIILDGVGRKKWVYQSAGSDTKLVRSLCGETFQIR